MSDIRYSVEVLHPPGLQLPRRQFGAGRHVIGRGSGCDLQIEARGVSREHVAIHIAAERGALLEDLGSTNGSQVDGETLSSRALSGDFVLALGDVRLQFHEHDPQLGSLVLRMPEWDASDAAPEASAALGRTQYDSELRRLREAAWPLLAASRLRETLGALLPRWAEILQARALQLCDLDGCVLAAAGDATVTLAPWCSGEHWTLYADAAIRPDAETREAIEQGLRWLGPCERPAQTVVAEPPRFPGVPSRHPGLTRHLQALSRVAQSKVAVLVLGETGCGKELVARWLHDCSPRRGGPFVAINCAALPRDLLEAELFGVEKGAATGVDARPGVFERADGGTLFLDELGDMPAETQVRLLRAVEEQRIHRIGGRRLVEVDVRLVAATHCDIAAAIESRQFRLDLYHRVAGFEVSLPPLRERRDDVAPLVAHFFARALADTQLASPGITQAAMRCLQGWHWPGNVRELRQAIEAATAMLNPGEALDAVHLPPRIAACARTGPELEPAPAAVQLPLAQAIVEAERAAFRAALTEARGDPEQAWSLLGIGKTTYYKKLKELGLAD